MLERMWRKENPPAMWTSLVAQTVKHLPTMRETWVQSLGWEDLLEKEMATHSSSLAWKIPWMEEPDRLQSTGSQRVGHNWVTSLSFFLSSPQGSPGLAWCSSVMDPGPFCLVALPCLQVGLRIRASPRSSVDIQTLRSYPDLLTQMWILTSSPGDSLYS